MCRAHKPDNKPGNKPAWQMAGEREGAVRMNRTPMKALLVSAGLVGTLLLSGCVFPGVPGPVNSSGSTSGADASESSNEGPSRISEEAGTKAIAKATATTYLAWMSAGLPADDARDFDALLADLTARQPTGDADAPMHEVLKAAIAEFTPAEQEMLIARLHGIDPGAAFYDLSEMDKVDQIALHTLSAEVSRQLSKVLGGEKLMIVPNGADRISDEYTIVAIDMDKWGGDAGRFVGLIFPSQQLTLSNASKGELVDGPTALSDFEFQFRESKLNN